MLKYANPSFVLRFVKRAIPILAVLSAVLIAIGLYLVFFVAPADYQQGETVRIMYIHVPAAWLGMFAYMVMSSAALGTLVWRHPVADAAQKAAAPPSTRRDPTPLSGSPRSGSELRDAPDLGDPGHGSRRQRTRISEIPDRLLRLPSPNPAPPPPSPFAHPYPHSLAPHTHTLTRSPPPLSPPGLLIAPLVSSPPPPDTPLAVPFNTPRIPPHPATPPARVFAPGSGPAPAAHAESARARGGAGGGEGLGGWAGRRARGDGGWGCGLDTRPPHGTVRAP